ncbi:negative regulator of flagellin synthesis FlgM [Psychromonas sp. CNPT3]|uniref:flagellar biosynthesis anti-sigma factor FlgM n=1 Tax=Psychromonas sp. CNPT3 TaxID=314282 RepID=UPI0002C06A92|nr:flagellar biosynthesis anti-sigma factor FlgM [Psychromonas sp. CNPT3]AGH80562.1 negative regulator of flagellin synthesis FlgM [Psychromonas sp. CNPT3]
MSININRQATQKNIVVEQHKAQAQKSSVKNAQNVNNDQHKDSVQLTSQAKNINKMQQQGATEPQVNKQRIESLKAAITNGDYKINTERLAQRLSQFEGDFSRILK